MRLGLFLGLSAPGGIPLDSGSAAITEQADTVVASGGTVTGFISIWDPNVAASVNTGTPADGDPVDGITDAIGGFTLSKFIDGYRPTYKTAILNGQAAFRFAGATQALRTAETMSYGASTVILVYKGNSPAAASTLYSSGNDAGTRQHFAGNTNSPNFRQQNAGGISDKNVGLSWIDNNSHTFFHLDDGTHAGHKTYLDNAAQTLTDGVNVADPGVTAFSRRFTLGATQGLGAPFTGDFFYMAIIDHALSASERTTIQTMLKSRFPALP